MSLCEHSNESFAELIRAIQALGFDEETAGRYAALIGDTPIIDKDGKIVVLDERGKVLDRLTLDYFSKSENCRKPQPNPNDPEFFFLYQAIKRHGVEDRKAARWAALVGLSGGPAIGQDGKFPVIDERGRELARLPASILTSRVTGESKEVFYLDGCQPAV